jgi:hypothetical protein
LAPSEKDGQHAMVEESATGPIIPDASVAERDKAANCLPSFMHCLIRDVPRSRLALVARILRDAVMCIISFRDPSAV